MSDVVEVQNSEDFQEKVIQSDKPVLVDFWAEWCGPCKQLAPLVEEIAKEHKDEITVCKMDVDNNRDTAASYGIRSIPTLMIFSNGELVGTEIGALTKQQLDEFVRSKILMSAYFFKFSLTLSKITTVSFIEYPTIVKTAATIDKFISKLKAENIPSVIVTS